MEVIVIKEGSYDSVGTVRKLRCAGCGVQELAAQKPPKTVVHSKLEFNWKTVHMRDADAFIMQKKDLTPRCTHYCYQSKIYYLIPDLVQNDKFDLCLDCWNGIKNDNPSPLFFVRWNGFWTLKRFGPTVIGRVDISIKKNSSPESNSVIR